MVPENDKGASLEWLTPCFLLEAASGFEPLNKGFADLCLTTWLRRLELLHIMIRTAGTVLSEMEHILYNVFSPVSTVKISR